MHNVTDGIAIGAAHASSSSGLAWATVVSVLAHELPHEVGDVAILVANGMSKRDAIAAQGVTALGALLGTGVGLMGGDAFNMPLVAFTSGGFVYVATVSTLPAVVGGAAPASFGAALTSVLAFGLGVAVMVVVAVMEEAGEGHHH